MKQSFLTLLLVSALSFAATPATHAYTISDEYWGGKPSSSTYTNQDVIGSSNYYDTQKMEVTFSGTILNVAVYSTFIGQRGSNQIWNDKTKLGDLFIGTNGWNPLGDSSNNYRTDTAKTTGTDWNYALVLDNHGPTYRGDTTASGSISLYDTSMGTAIMSNAPSGYIFRKDQLVQFSPNKNMNAIATGTWTITDLSGTNYDKLLFSIDVSDLLDITTSHSWAFHWAMTCGNDVIEGAAPIPNPEPSTLLLCGVGLLGAVYFRKRKNT